MSQEDLPLSVDIAEVNREAQVAVDRVVRARVELSAAIQNVVEVRGTIALGSAAAVGFIDDYMNPAVANPEPVAPEVADETLPPEEEIPVFTTVEEPEVNFVNTSGGEVETELAIEEMEEEFVPYEQWVEENTVVAEEEEATPTEEI
jgi:hypothetical protein